MAQSTLEILLKVKDLASAELKKFGNNIDKLAASSRQLATAGAGFIAVGAGIGLGLNKAAKEAIQMEDAFAGVRKTVDATEKEFGQLTDNFKRLSRETPVTFTEIAKIGELAGQLGVSGVNDLTKFTDTIAKIGVTTDLSTDQAATAFAQFANIMGTNLDEVDRLGSAVVGLGNNFATTESRIVEMAQRLAGAGKALKISEADVFGIATALASLGIEAQAGGTSVSKALISIASSVELGDDRLAKFAETAGQTVDEFSEAFKKDAATAFSTFITGLQRIDAEGGSVFQTLEELGFADIRLRDALLRLTGAGDILNETLAKSAIEFENNNALSIEAEKRFGTTASQLQILQNNVDNLAGSFGEALLPILAKIVEASTSLLNRFNELSPATKQIIVVGGAFVALVTILTGTILVLAGTLGFLSIALGGAGIALLPFIGFVLLAVTVISAIIIAFVLWKDEILSFIQNAMLKLGNATIALATALKNAWLGIGQTIVTTLETIRAVIAEKIALIVEFVTEKIGNLITAWTENWEQAKTTVVSVFEGIKGTIDTVVGFIQRRIQDAIDAFEKLKSLASGGIGGIGAGVGKIGRSIRNAVPFADGGIVSRPTLGLVGESGPEAIVPLGRGGGLGNNIVVNISGNVFAEDADRLGTEVGDAIMNRLGLNMRIG